ncbi:phage integrase central domain-containing protein [Lysobacter sp. 22409]|uniref:phage integrase central domain-containing protein n=1 Tax=Lysobacter sp. 22409 TaxID=3453917 RepID=UPI003F830485
MDLGERRKAAKAAGDAAAANSSEVTAHEWFALQKIEWADSHADKFIRPFEEDIFPWMGTGFRNHDHRTVEAT